MNRKILPEDVMGRTELHHYDDLDKIEVDGIIYELEDILD